MGSISLKSIFLSASIALAPFATTAVAYSSDFLSELDHSQLGENSLWRVVHVLCEVSSKMGIAFPCLSVTENKGGLSGWALLSVGPDHILTVPTRKIAGIESPDILNPAMPNFWNVAWQARKFLASTAEGPIARDRVALVINSVRGRSQNQLHIHTSCIRQDVSRSVKSQANVITGDWGILKPTIDGIHYRVKSVESGDLKDTNIFHQLPAAVQSKPDAMARQTIAVIGATLPDGKPGFYILNDQTRGRNLGHAETLLDTSCGESS
jgi:CDP-diacylglycerol pyrophosphatase